MTTDPSLIDVMAYLIKHHPPEWSNGLSETRINNLVYLADLYHRKEYGRWVAGIEEWGASKFEDSGVRVPIIIKTLESHKEIFTIKEKGNKKRFVLKDDSFPQQLSNETKEILDRVIEETKDLHGDKQNDFFKLIHATPPMQGVKPGGRLNF